jgi:hypothetical protein
VIALVEQFDFLQLLEAFAERRLGVVELPLDRRVSCSSHAAKRSFTVRAWRGADRYGRDCLHRLAALRPRLVRIKSSADTSGFVP